MAVTQGISTQIGTGSDTLVLKVTQDAYQGDAQYAVFVDGKQVGGTFTASALHNSGQFDTLEIKGDWGVGNHTVSVKLLNDRYDGSATADRNVYVESATYNGVTVTGSKQIVDNADAKSFTVADSTPVPSTTIPTPIPTPAPTPPSEVKPAPPASISIKDFGAVADGVTDNTYAIQQALNYASTFGVELYVPPGVFVHTGLLKADRVSIVGAGESSVLKATGAVKQAIMLSGNGVSMKNLALDSNGTTRSAGTADDNKITVMNSTKFEISGVTIHNSLSAGILVLNSSNGWIHGNKVNSTGSDSIRLTSSSHTIRVEKNIIREAGDDGIAVLSFYGQVPTRNIEIVGNEVYDNLWGRNLAVIGGKDVKILNNLANGNKSGAAGIYTASETDYNTLGVENVLVKGNTVLNTGGGGIRTQVAQASLLAHSGTGRPMVNIDFINNKVVPPTGVKATSIKGVAGTDAYFSDNTPTTTPLPIQVSQWSYTAPVGGTLPVTSGTLSGDTITASDTASDAVQGLDGDDKIYGRRGNDVLDGGSGNDLLDGGNDEDLIHGGSGRDVIYGGYQGDVLYGGADADTFVLRIVQESPVAARDTIGDFLTGVDKVDLRSVDSVSSVTGDQAFRFIGATAFSGRAGELRYADGLLSGDVNGDRVADLQIKFTNLPSMSASDILL